MGGFRGSKNRRCGANNLNWKKGLVELGWTIFGMNICWWRSKPKMGYTSPPPWAAKDMYGRSLTRPAPTATDKWGNWGQVGVYNQVQGQGPGDWNFTRCQGLKKQNSFATSPFCWVEILYDFVCSFFFLNHRWLLWELLGIHKKKFCGAMKMMGTFFSQGNMVKEQVLEITQTWRIEKLEMDTWHIDV